MAGEEFYTIVLHDSHQYLPGRFRWVDCQLKYLADCDPADILERGTDSSLTPELEDA